MKSFYSLIKVSPNTLSDENLTIGIILSDKNEYLVKFSNERKTIAKSLIYFDSELIDFIVTEIENKLNRTNHLKLKYDFFEDLSYYSNGVLIFSDPKLVSIETTEKNLGKLFNLFVEPDNKTVSYDSFKHHHTV